MRTFLVFSERMRRYAYWAQSGYFKYLMLSKYFARLVQIGAGLFLTKC